MWVKISVMFVCVMIDFGHVHFHRMQTILPQSVFENELGTEFTALSRRVSLISANTKIIQPNYERTFLNSENEKQL